MKDRDRALVMRVGSRHGDISSLSGKDDVCDVLWFIILSNVCFVLVPWPFNRGDKLLAP